MSVVFYCPVCSEVYFVIARAKVSWAFSPTKIYKICGKKLVGLLKYIFTLGSKIKILLFVTFYYRCSKKCSILYGSPIITKTLTTFNQ